MTSAHLAGAAVGKGHELPAWIEGLALGVGKDVFGARLIEALSESIDADDCAAFQYHATGVRTLAVGSVRNVQNTRLAAERYEAAFWKRDKFLLSHRMATQSQGPEVFSIATRDIGDKQFRRDCYEFQNVKEQMSVRLRTPSGLFSLSAFWGQRPGRTREHEVQRISAVANTLLAFVVRHAEISKTDAQRVAKLVSLADAEILIRRLGGGLSEREIAVCARVLRCMTMQGIALDLGLSVHSVVTYKRRAFYRLHITTTVELFSLCMPATSSASV
jgi:DNA-binding CsgD family transcriptional regulator